MPMNPTDFTLSELKAIVMQLPRPQRTKRDHWTVETERGPMQFTKDADSGTELSQDWDFPTGVTAWVRFYGPGDPHVILILDRKWAFETDRRRHDLTEQYEKEGLTP